MLSRIFVILVLLAPAHANAQSAAWRCWMKGIAAEGGSIRLKIDTTVSLRIYKNGNLLAVPNVLNSSSSNSTEREALSQPWEILIQENDQLEISTVEDRPSRCVVEPITGPSFSGVSATMWSYVANSDQPMVMARTFRADHK